MARIAFIGVSYNTNSQCEELVHFIADSSVKGLDVFIVNNSALSEKDSSLENLQKLLPGAVIINAPWNPGYFGGAQLALNRINLKDYDWVVVANVDIKIADSEFWSKLRAMPIDKGIGVVAPSLVSSLTGSETNPFMSVRPSSRRMHFYRYIFSNLVSSWVYHVGALIKYKLKKITVMGEKASSSKGPFDEIYAAHGAFMIFSREYFNRGGNLNHGAYMYGEEIFVAETCRSLKLRSIFAPSLKVLHIERASTGLLYSKKVLAWKKDSSRYLWKEFFSE